MDNIDRYLTHIDKVTGYRRNLARVERLSGQPLAGEHALSAVPIEWGVPTAAGFLAGGLLGAQRGHWLLGAISGASILTNAPAALKQETRNEALWNLAQTHGGVFASLLMKENKAFGFALGYLAVGIARYLSERQT